MKGSTRGPILVAHGIERMGGAYEQRAPIGLAPVQIGDEFGNPHLAEKRARARIDPYAAGRRHPDIPGAVTFHAVGDPRLQFGADAGGENPVWAKRAVSVDIEDADQRTHRVVDIQQPLVGRKTEAVRLVEQVAIDDKLRLAAARRHAVDALEAELARPLDPVDRHSPVPGIGEIDRAVRAHADVVRAVEFLAFEMRRENFAPAIALANEARCRVLAHDQLEVGVVGHAVAFVGRLHHFAHAAARVVAASHVGRHVREQQILIDRMPDRPLGEREAAGQLLDRRVEIDQLRELAT